MGTPDVGAVARELTRGDEAQYLAGHPPEFLSLTTR